MLDPPRVARGRVTRWIEIERQLTPLSRQTCIKYLHSELREDELNENEEEIEICIENDAIEGQVTCC